MENRRYQTDRLNLKVSEILDTSIESNRNKTKKTSNFFNKPNYREKKFLVVTHCIHNYKLYI